MNGRGRRVAYVIAIGLLAAAAFAQPAAVQRAALEQLDPRAAPLLRLQPFLTAASSAGADGTRLTLVNVNPRVGAWYLLYRQGPGGAQPAAIHLENPLPRAQSMALDDRGLSVATDGARHPCTLRMPDGRDAFAAADQPLIPICDGRLFIRSQQRGYRTTEEAVVAWLRGLGQVGEALINLYKETVGQDAELERAQTQPRHDAQESAAPDRLVEPGVPRAAEVEPGHARSAFAASQLGITLRPNEGEARAVLRPGAWHASALHPGVHVSLIAPLHIAAGVFERDAARVSALDASEMNALVYLLAFDLEMYRWRFHLGTDHPGVEWSPRPSAPHTPPQGPDGFSNLRPFARVGMVAPQERPGLVAVIVGGFKREHGAFRYGALSQTNNGSHYGFAESGVVLSRLQPGLSTLFGRIDGSTDLRLWTERDAAEMPRLDWARQNGVPLIEADPISGRATPGAFVRSWGLGNWSGALVISTDPEGHPVRSAELRSVRAGACLQTHAGHRFMIYAYFSAATPSAMARVFQAYHCQHAMLLDMNSPELTYAALVQISGEQVRVEHLNQAMAASEPARGRYRFIHANDNRDFFSVTRRTPPP